MCPSCFIVVARYSLASSSASSPTPLPVTSVGSWIASKHFGGSCGSGPAFVSSTPVSFGG